MNLFLLRHGLAAERNIPGFQRDSDRPLTPEGRKKTAGLAAGLKHLHLSFDLIITSPYVRARQTAEVVAQILKLRKQVELSKDLTPGSSPRPLIEQLRSGRPMDDVLLVGHEPDLSRLISVLVTGKHGLALELKKGGLCKLEIGILRYGRCATLQWLVTPKLWL